MILFYFWKLKLNLTDLLISIVLTLLLSFFPVKPSVATLVQTTNITVGYVHKLLIVILGTNSVIEKLVLGIFLVIGSYMSIELIRILFKILKESTRDHKIIFTFLWILFLVIMPFSYQVWEKYLLMILPFLALSTYKLIFLQSEIIKTKL